MPKSNKHSFTYLRVLLATLVTLIAIPLLSLPSMAGRVTFRPPSDPAPKSSSGGASRDGSLGVAACSSARSGIGQSVTPVLPTTNIGFTLTEHPTVFVYVPASNARKAFFSIQDEDNNHVYQADINLPKQPGVMQVKLPTSAPGLKTNKNYKWSLVMICTADLEPDSPFVSGWIRRVEYKTNIRNNQNKNITLDSVSELAETGIWYDTLATLAQLRLSQPNNQVLATSWANLLSSVGLNAIANEPLVQ
ncbi:hypothetical protein NIES4071_44450 [Calothrix sp. NIES-4071]|nr:hypothetical protein NIES4071_44450 [Calothrix sp. NIES-4071]BAZ58758.1 hypothetical protein NIES4105_44380 [Calothrix sp. NIES-4105]